MFMFMLVKVMMISFIVKIFQRFFPGLLTNQTANLSADQITINEMNAAKTS